MNRLLGRTGPEPELNDDELSADEPMIDMHEALNESYTEMYHPTEGPGSDGPRKIGLGVKVENILEVDEEHNSFKATIKLSYEWKLTRKEHEDYKNGKWVDGKPPWIPVINMVDNLHIEHHELLLSPYSKEHTAYYVYQHPKKSEKFPEGGSWWVNFYERYRGGWAEVFELASFPFDCQDLTMKFQSWDATEAVLCPRFKSDNFMSVDLESCAIGVLWTVHHPIATFEFDDGSKSRSNQRRSIFQLQMKIYRKSAYFVTRIMLLCSLMTASNILAFTMREDDSNRLMMTFTVLLTLIAYQLSVTESLPPVSYYTLLDKYMVMCQAYIFILGIIQALSIADYNIEKFYLGRGCGVFFAVMHVLFYRHAKLIIAMEKEKLYLSHVELDLWTKVNQAHCAAHTDVYKVLKRTKQDGDGWKTFTTKAGVIEKHKFEQRKGDPSVVDLIAGLFTFAKYTLVNALSILVHPRKFNERRRPRAKEQLAQASNARKEDVLATSPTH